VNASNSASGGFVITDMTGATTYVDSVAEREGFEPSVPLGDDQR
jgi:hypothetical protein